MYHCLTAYMCVCMYVCVIAYIYVCMCVCIHVGMPSGVFAKANGFGQ
jgi:hypothetical protein